MSGQEGITPRQRLTVAHKLDHLLKLHAKPGNDDKPSYKTMATEIAAQSGETFSGAYLWQLHRGERTNPTLRHLSALAAYFGVPVSYFTDDDVARSVIDEEDLARRELDRSMAEAGVSAVYLRGDLTALSPEGKRMAADMIRQIRALEQGTKKPPSPPRA
ncbi:helix-turn-helix domain-containing protein [Streptomyces sp. Edi2]|uniref:helix-turn-helix domain-containing protein n=1 Tax=Streptomyces sp. Edi2 TaxID=3162528 RepID=UPI0033057F32